MISTPKKNSLSILNLAGEISSELKTYLGAREFLVVDPMATAETHEWTHILTRDIHDFSLLRGTYSTLEKDIKIISLTPVNDMQNFVLANGKLIYEEIWLETGLGEFILDKFFQEYAGVGLGDNYPKFTEQGNFQIVNPFNTGEYLDRMIHHAYTSEFDALTVKTYFDHLLMFLSGLKTKGKIGLPLEVTYGSFGDFFGLQFHFYSKGLMLEDVMSSLSSPAHSQRTEDYLLNMSVHSSDFFDFTFLSDVNKIVITGLWTRDERVKYENKGMMLAQINTAAAIPNFPLVGVTSPLAEEAEIEDFSSKVILPSTAEVSEGKTHISGSAFSENVAERISSDMEIEKIKQIVSGDFQEEIFSQIVKGALPPTETAQVIQGAGGEDDVKIKVSSQAVMDDILNVVKGHIEEEKEALRIPGTKFNVDNFAYRISTELSNKMGGDDHLKSKVLKDQLPETIKKGLFEFRSLLKKDNEELTDSEIEQFKNTEIPKLLKLHADLDPKREEDEKKTKNFLNNFKKTLVADLMEEFLDENVDNLIASISNTDGSQKARAILKSTLKKALDKEFHLSEKNNISEGEQEVLVKALTSSLKEDEEKVRAIVVKGKVDSNLNETTPLFSGREPVTDPQVAALKKDNEELKSKIKFLMSEMRALKEARNKFNDIVAKSQEVSKDPVEMEIIDSDQAIREKFAQKLQAKQPLNSGESNELAALLERERKLILDARNEEVKAKKLSIESSNKEILFLQEIENNQRQIKAKDSVIAKSKEILAQTMERKDHEIKELQQKVDQLNKLLNSNRNHIIAADNQALEKQNINLTKLLDVYKNKLSILVENMQRQGPNQEEVSTKEDLRKIQMNMNKLQFHYDNAKKEAAKLKERLDQESSLVMNLKTDKARLEQVLKKATLDMTSQPVIVSTHDQADEIKKLEASAQLAETQYKEAQLQIKDLEQRLLEAQKLQKFQNSEDGSKVKINQLETSLKKITQDLIESRNQMGDMKKEVNKLRQEKTAAQNQLDKLKKDIEREKAAALKKTNGRAA